MSTQKISFCVIYSELNKLKVNNVYSNDYTKQCITYPALGAPLAGMSDMKSYPLRHSITTLVTHRGECLSIINTESHSLHHCLFILSICASFSH